MSKPEKYAEFPLFNPNIIRLIMAGRERIAQNTIGAGDFSFQSTDAARIALAACHQDQSTPPTSDESPEIRQPLDPIAREIVEDVYGPREDRE